MRIAAFDTIEPSGPIARLPARIVQTSARATRALQIAIGSVLAGAMAVPFAFLLTVSVEHPAARDIILQRPAAGMQIALGIVLWTALFALPLRRVLARLKSREIVITDREINVIERGLLRTTAWSEPVGAYRGLAHHIRASVSGVRHELILVHPRRDRSVLMTFADRLHQAEMDRLARLLGVAQIHPRELYGAAPAAVEPASAPLGGLRTA